MLNVRRSRRARNDDGPQRDIYAPMGMTEFACSYGRELPSKLFPRSWGRIFLGFVLVTWCVGITAGFQAALVVLTAVGFGSAIVGLRWPTMGMLGIGLLCVLNPLVTRLIFSNGFLSWNTFNYWLLTVILVSLPILSRRSDIQTRLIQSFVMLLAVQTIVSSDRMTGVQQTFEVMVLFGLLAYFGRVTWDGDDWYCWGIINGTLAALGGLVFCVQRAHLPYVNPNVWARFPLGAIFCLCLASHAVEGRGRRQQILAMLAAICFVWVFLSGSRGAMLIGCVSLLYLLGKVPGGWRRCLILGFCASLAFAITAWFAALSSDSLGRIDKLLSADQSFTARTSGRYDLALGGWYTFLDHPLGVGTGSFARTWAALGPREELSGYALHEHKAAHSGWIRTLAENGIPGMALLVAYVVSFAIVGSSQRECGAVALGLLVTFTLGVAFVSTELNNKGLWLLAAGAMVMLRGKDTSDAVAHHGALESC